MSNLHVKTGDTVVVLSGKDKGKKGKVLSADPANGMVVVEGVNMATRHKKPRKQGQPGGILKQEAPLYACKTMKVCPKCQKPTRRASKILADGTKVSVCKQCGETL